MYVIMYGIIANDKEVNVAPNDKTFMIERSTKYEYAKALTKMIAERINSAFWVIEA